MRRRLKHNLIFNWGYL